MTDELKRLLEQPIVNTEPLSPEQQKAVDEYMARREAVFYMESLDIPATMPALREKTKQRRALEAKWEAEGTKEVLALTDQHVTALARAIEAEGYTILTDPETGEVKLERAE